MASDNNLSWWAVGAVTLVSGLVLAIPDPIPLSGVAAVSLAAAAWAKKLGVNVMGFGGGSQPAQVAARAVESEMKKNPIGLMTAAAIGIPLLLGAATAGTAAVYFYQKKKEREDVVEAIQSSPLRFINPAVFGAAGGMLPYLVAVMSKSPYRPGLRDTLSAAMVGGAVGYAAQKLITEVLFTYHDIPVDSALNGPSVPPPVELFDVQAEEMA